MTDTYELSATRGEETRTVAGLSCLDAFALAGVLRESRWDVRILREDLRASDRARPSAPT